MAFPSSGGPSVPPQTTSSLPLVSPMFSSNDYDTTSSNNSFLSLYAPTRLMCPLPSLPPPVPLPSQPVQTGTTIIAASFNNGIVLGADTRTSAGSFIVNRAARKISRLHERLFVCRSGSAADTQAVTNIVKLYLSEHALELGVDVYPRVIVAAKLFQKFCWEYKHMLTAGLIIGGWDLTEGGQIYSIPIGGTLVKTPYAAGGSGSVFVSGYMDSKFREGMSKQECVEFVKHTIGHAIARDGSSGGMIRIVVVQEEGVEEQVVLGNELPVTL